MVRLCRVILLIAFLFSGASRSCGASAEDKAFKQAAKQFDLESWDSAANEFAAFTTNYPMSFRVPEAIFYQAEARIKDGQFTTGINLLTANQYRAGELGDLYLYWIAQGHLGNTNFPAAAQAFGELKKNFLDSAYRLEACVSEAAAYAKLEHWPRVSELLSGTNSIFRQITAGATNDLVARGYLILGEAELEQQHFDRARAAAQFLRSLPLNPEFAWRGCYLQSRLEMAGGNLDAASANSTNLIALASATGNRRWRAESFALVADILERMKDYDRAIAALEENLSTNAPVEQLRIAVLKIAELSLAQNNPSNAVRRLEAFWNQYPKTEAADTVLLTLGELQLQQAIGGREVSTNLLDQAAARFDALLRDFPASPLEGKARLNKGWCLWYGGDFGASEEVFRSAIEKLPVSLDQAVARFKLADAQFKLRKLNEAIASYSALTNGYATAPEVKSSLLEQALYQTVRSALDATNLVAATNAMEKILDWYPKGMAGDQCLLLVSERDAPARAQELLRRFESQLGAETNTLLPEIRLARARTFEKEGDWQAAITNYDAWITSFTNHPKMPEALFARAWDTAKAGQETNALALFGNFVTQFPAHPLTARAKWWIGDYYFQQGNYAKAELNYPFTDDFASSDLYFPAHLRAGRAAILRGLGYKDAIGYFTNLIGNPACPADIKVKAAMAAGDAYMSRNEIGATNRMADLEEAAAYFNFVLKNYPTNSQVPAAWGLLGNCYKELGAVDAKYYERAAEAYGRVVSFPGVSLGSQRKAMVGLGVLAEAKVEAKTGDEQKALLKEAFKHYLDAFTFSDLQEGDPDDLYWMQKAGMESARLTESFGEWSRAINIYVQLLALPNLSPAFQATLDKRISKAREHLASAKS